MTMFSVMFLVSFFGFQSLILVDFNFDDVLAIERAYLFLIIVVKGFFPIASCWNRSFRIEKIWSFKLKLFLTHHLVRKILLFLIQVFQGIVFPEEVCLFLMIFLKKMSELLSFLSHVARLVHKILMESLRSIALFNVKILSKLENRVTGIRNFLLLISFDQTLFYFV